MRLLAGINILLTQVLLFAAASPTATPTGILALAPTGAVNLSPMLNTFLIADGVNISLPQPLDDLQKRDSADLYWGPVYVGNLKLTLTNDHGGPVGTHGYMRHVNLHLYRLKNPPARGWKELLNLHIVKYSSGGHTCYLIYDGVSKKDIFNDCFGNWSSALKGVISAVHEAIDTVLKNANFVAAVAVISALVVVLGMLLGSMAVVAIA